MTFCPLHRVFSSGFKRFANSKARPKVSLGVGMKMKIRPLSIGVTIRSVAENCPFSSLSVRSPAQVSAYILKSYQQSLIFCFISSKLLFIASIFRLICLCSPSIFFKVVLLTLLTWKCSGLMFTRKFGVL